MRQTQLLLFALSLFACGGKNSSRQQSSHPERQQSLVNVGDIRFEETLLVGKKIAVDLIRVPLPDSIGGCWDLLPNDFLIGQIICKESGERKDLTAINVYQLCTGSPTFEPKSPDEVLVFEQCQEANVRAYQFVPELSVQLL